MNNYTPTNCIANKRNGLVPRDIHSPRLYQEETENLNRQLLVRRLKQQSKMSQERKAQGQTISLANSTKYLKFNTYPYQTLPKCWRGEKTFRHILQNQHYPDTKTRWVYYERRNYRPIPLQMVTEAVKLKGACSLEEKLWPAYTGYLKAETLLCQQRSI